MRKLQPCRYLLLLCALFLLLLPGLSMAASVDSAFSDANAAYSVGDYNKAISLYEKIGEENGLAPSVLYNLANSYAQKGEIGKAVLNYERASRLDPGDSDISGNLAKLRKDAGLFIPEPSRIDKFFSVVSIDGWALLVLTSLVALVLLLGYRYRFTLSRRMFGWSTGLALALLMVAVAGISYNYSGYNPLIVVGKDVKLQVSPFEGANPVGAIAEGKELLPLGKGYGEYIYVQDMSGRKGWLHRGGAEAVCN